MSCIGDILADIDARPDGDIIVCRDYLHYGSSPAVYKAFSRLKKVGVLIRPSRGMYIKAGTEEIPTAFEASVAKAGAFGKQVVTHGRQLAREFNLLKRDTPKRLEFLVNGRSSSFLFFGQRIYLHGTVAKKMQGGETVVAKVVRSLSWLDDSPTEDQLTTAINLIKPQERQLLIRAARWMSQWLADDIKKFLRRPESVAG